MARKSKKKNKAYVPGKDPVPASVNDNGLAVTKFRAQHSREGHDFEQLAAGFDRSGGMVRARERAMLTPLGLQRDMLEAYLQKIRKENEDVVIDSRQAKIAITPSDKVIADNPNTVHDYIQTHLEVIAHRINIADYEGSIGGGNLNKLPLAEKEFFRRAFYGWVQDNAPLAVTTILNQVCEQCNAEVIARATGREPEDAITKAEIGRYWVNKHEYDKGGNLRQQSERDAVNHADGALAIAANILNELHMNYLTLKRRKKELEKIFVDHRKKLNYC